jgi:hypothetical protein
MTSLSLPPRCCPPHGARSDGDAASLAPCLATVQLDGDQR